MQLYLNYSLQQIKEKNMTLEELALVTSMRMMR